MQKAEGGASPHGMELGVEQGGREQGQGGKEQELGGKEQELGGKEQGHKEQGLQVHSRQSQGRGKQQRPIKMHAMLKCYQDNQGEDLHAAVSKSDQELMIQIC